MRFLAILVILAICFVGYRCATSTSRPAAPAVEPGPYGFFTYTAIDGSTVTVARHQPDMPERTIECDGD